MKHVRVSEEAWEKIMAIKMKDKYKDAAEVVDKLLEVNINLNKGRL